MSKDSDSTSPASAIPNQSIQQPGLHGRIIGLLDLLSDRFAGILFVLNIINIAIAVFMRYVLLNSFIWTAELSQFMLVWMVLFGATSAWKRNEHMRIDLLLRHLPPAIRRIAAILRDIFILMVALFMTIWGIIYANTTWRITTLGLKIPKAIPLFAISIGMGLFFLMSLLLVIGRGWGSEMCESEPFSTVNPDRGENL